MKTVFVLFAAAFVFAAFAAAQTTPPPSAPACLSGPVTNGNITLSCSAVNAIAGGVDALSGLYVFGINASSIDSAVVALRVTLTITASTDPNASNATTAKVVTIPQNANGGFTYAFLLNPTWDAKGNASATMITGITIQELKPATSQPF